MSPRFYLSTLIIALSTPQSFAIENNLLTTELPLLIESAYNSDNPQQVIKNKAVQLATNLVNDQLKNVEDKAQTTTDFTHLELSLGTDSFGLDAGNKFILEGLGVYRLHETDRMFIFNQSSFVLFDERNTFNTGFGVRTINADNTLILGANLFYDYESNSGHSRHGYGAEALTSVLEFRTNEYRANTGTIVYQGINETALDGRDYSITAQLPYFYSSNIYAKQGTWFDDAGYSTKHKEWGTNLELYPNLTLRLASQQTDNADSKFTGAITYTRQLGADFSSPVDSNKQRTSNQLTSVKDKFYQPVQRENRIQKKSIKLGVTVSGY